MTSQSRINNGINTGQAKPFNTKRFMLKKQSRFFRAMHYMQNKLYTDDLKNKRCVLMRAACNDLCINLYIKNLVRIFG